MRNVFTIAKNSLKLTFRKKSNIFVYIILPILVCVGIIYFFSRENEVKTNIGVVDKDKSIISSDMIYYLEELGKFNISYVSDENIESDIASGEIDVAFIIDKGFEKSLIKGKPKVIKAYSIKGADVSAWIENYSNMYVKNIVDIGKATNNEDEFKIIYDKFKSSELKIVEENIEDTASGKLANKTGYGMFLMFIMISSSSVASLILREKKNRTYHRICTSSVKSSEYIMGNVVANMILLLIQVVSVILIIYYILGIKTYMSPGAFFIIIITFGVATIGLGMMIVSFAKTSDSLSALSTLIITPTCMLSGCFWPVEVMPKVFQKISYFMPQGWVMSSITQIQNGGVIGDIWVNLLVLLCFALAFFSISIYKFKFTKNVQNFV